MIEVLHTLKEYNDSTDEGKYLFSGTLYYVIEDRSGHFITNNIDGDLKRYDMYELHEPEPTPEPIPDPEPDPEPDPVPEPEPSPQPIKQKTKSYFEELLDKTEAALIYLEDHKSSSTYINKFNKLIYPTTDYNKSHDDLIRQRNDLKRQILKEKQRNETYKRNTLNGISHVLSPQFCCR